MHQKAYLPFLLGCLLTSQFLFAQKLSLSIGQIMQGDRFVGFLPENVFWGDDNQTIYFSWNPGMDTLRSLYKVSISGGEPQKVSAAEQRALLSGGTYTRDVSRKITERNGDLFLVDVASNSARAINQPLDRESGASFADGDTKVVFSRNNNLFVWNILDGSTSQLTDFRSGAAPAEKKPTPQEAWLTEQQLDLFEVLEWRKGQREAREKQNKLLEPDRPKTYYTGTKQLTGLDASPDLRFITFQLIKRAESKRTDVPDYVAESGFTANLPSRPKVGSPMDSQEFGIYDTERDTFYFVDPKTLPGISDKPEFLKDYHKGAEAFKPQYDKPREVNYAGPVFSDDGRALLVIRSQDNKDRWIVSLDLPTGAMRLIDRQRDEAWVGGPGIGWSGGAGNVGFLMDTRKVWYQSEETGYSHLYVADLETGEKKALTEGKFEILSARLSRDRQYFFLTANAEGPHERHFYRLSVHGGPLEKITSMTGNNEVSVSPDEKYLAIRYSYSNKPWEVYWMENRPGAPATQLTRSTTPEFNRYPWSDPQIVWFKARDGVMVPARLYRPAKPKKGGPAVIFVHGAGYTQNVHKWWASYFREFMFHHFLADNGYTVLDIDYRASEGYGRDWRTAIYRHMGGKDLDDQVDGARYLVSQYGVDAKKVGIYGGSYGGFMTLMALFNAPETFRSGAALRSVTDWAHYNHGYTANILNTPVEDSIAYQRSSPINFAEGLKGDLLILHGMVDVNVHFQDVVRLSQRLIELKKERWEFAVFPMEDHGFMEPSSWTDEYRRIFELFERTLK
ncbi:MAG: S9 family peptidase [Haliscomenobacter sp.]|nr:S9 family peptidase [Haliscomenobacter sp.]